MTTEVIVKANHGWPVLVRQLPAGGAASGWSKRVEPGETTVFHVHAGADLLIHELQPGTSAESTEEPILRYFAWEHLPDALRFVSRPFALMAEALVATLPRNPERSVALRKLLESKDCAVRAAVAR